MKFSQISTNKRAIKVVRFRLGNAPVPDGLAATDPIPDDEYTHKVGLRVLTGAEVAQVYANARADAKSKGSETWLDDDPLCRLYEMAHTVHVACVDPDSGESCEPFFASVNEVLTSPALGSDNIAYLHEQQGIWQDECSLKTEGRTIEEVMGFVVAEAERPENVESPLARMRPSTRENLVRTMAGLLYLSVRERSLSGSIATSSGTSTKKSDEKPAAEGEA